MILHGETRTFLSHKAPIFGEHHAIIGLIGTSLEITELKTLQQKLEASHQNALQVAHDIRSPLAALNTCLKYVTEIPEKYRVMMRNAANSINDIANNLLTQHRKKDAADKTGGGIRIWLLAPLLESMVSQKRLALEGRALQIETEISTAGFSAFAKCDATEMKRLLSNLMNNALEAFPAGQAGVITLSLDVKDHSVVLTVKDNGCGIPADKIEEVMKPGVSLKAEGNGLGLPHAKKTVENWGGKLTLSSVLGQGSCIELKLSAADAPAWFVSSIEVSSQTPIGILDDDASVHDAWDQKLDAASPHLCLHHFRNSKDLMAWYRTQTTPVQIFSDYELIGDPLTGLQALEDLGCGENALLVTSHYEDPAIIERCQKLGIRLLPKNLLPHVLIHLKDEPPAVDVVLIDSDSFNHQFWRYGADYANKKLLCFFGLSKFEAAMETAPLPKTTPIYIDLMLRDGVSGLDVAQTLRNRGFTQLYIAAGHINLNHCDYPWLAGVIDKAPPFLD